MRKSVISRLCLLALLSLMACNRNKMPPTTAMPEAWLTFHDQKSGKVTFPIENISAEWEGRYFSLAVSTADGRILQIQRLETDSLPGFYEGGSFQLVYIPGNFQPACISRLIKKNNLEVIKTETGYSLLLKGAFDCPDFNYTVSGALPITEPASPRRTTYPIAR